MVFFAISDNAVNVFVYIKNVAHLTAVNIAFWRWNSEDFAH